MPAGAVARRAARTLPGLVVDLTVDTLHGTADGHARIDAHWPVAGRAEAGRFKATEPLAEPGYPALVGPSTGSPRASRPICARSGPAQSSSARESRSRAMAALRRAMVMNISSPRSVWPTIMDAITAMTRPAKAARR